MQVPGSAAIFGDYPRYGSNLGSESEVRGRPLMNASQVSHCR